jgi:epoxyqueuosine reductase
MMLKNEIKAYCDEIGIDLFGVTSPEPFNRYLSELEERKDHYSARWGYRMETWRNMATPKKILPDARSVIVIGYYFLTPPPSEDGHRGKMGRIVAFGHLAILKRVKLLARFLESKGYKAIPGGHRKEAAVRAGLGQIGKHCLVINKKYGSWVAYQSIITDAELEFDEPFTEDLCGTCEKCIKECPTQALYETHRVNPLKCVCGLLTAADIPEEHWDKLNLYILGCDLCQECCPLNEDLEPKQEVENLLPSWIGIDPLLEELLKLNEKSFQKNVIPYITGKITGSSLLGFMTRYAWSKKLLKKFKGNSGGKETVPETFVMASGKLEAYQRNAIIAAGTIGSPDLREVVEPYLAHPGLDKYASWAMERINA